MTSCIKDNFSLWHVPGVRVSTGLLHLFVLSLRTKLTVKIIGRNISRYYFGYSSGVTKKFGSLPLHSIPKVIDPALYTCCHNLYVNFTFVSFSWFLLLRHLPHPFCAIFHSPLPLKKRLRTQELKPLTPPQRFKHCEQP